MIYEVTLKRTIETDDGTNKNVSEKYYVDNVEFCAEAEQKILEEFGADCECTNIKKSPVQEFINPRNASCFIFLAKLEIVTLDEKSGEEKTTPYLVAIFEETVEAATKSAAEYLKGSMQDMRIASIKKTKFIDLL